MHPVNRIGGWGLLICTALVVVVALNAAVVASGALDGITLTEALVDEFRIRVLPAPTVIRDCRSLDGGLVPLCDAEYGGYNVKIPKSHIHVNSAGFRGWEYAAEKGERVFRIFMVGDSFTFGSGVDDRETFAALLEERLGQSLNTWSIEVFNLGVPGAGPEQEYARLVHYLNYSPDMIILQTLPDDVIECHMTGGDVPSTLEGERDEGWYRQARAYYLALDTDTRCACALQYLQGIVEMAEGLSIPLLIYEFDYNPGFPCFTDVEGNEIYYLRAQTYSRNYRLSRLDGHLNVAGHERAAKELFPVVTSLMSSRTGEGGN